MLEHGYELPVTEASPDEGAPSLDSLVRLYDISVRQEWRATDLPWGVVPPIPELSQKASPARRAQRKDNWRSVITQQFQADQAAVAMTAQLLNLAPHPEAKKYYTKMNQEEAIHTEAWLLMSDEVGGFGEEDPFFKQLAKKVLEEAETLEEKVFLMQAFYERMVLERFKIIERAAGLTVMGNLAGRLIKDDGRHHASGMAYESVLLHGASPKTKDRVARTAIDTLPVLVGHILWRPKTREHVSGAMRHKDAARIEREAEAGIKIAASLGIIIDKSQLDLSISD